MTIYTDNWFSNFIPFEAPLIHEGISYPTPEHFFQAMKSYDAAERHAIALADTPGKSKRLGRRVMLRHDWDEVKFKFMAHALSHKFAPGTRFHLRLLATGSEEIVEWNNWGDTVWGKDIKTGRGENHLGRLLMQLRDELRTVPLNIWDVHRAGAIAVIPTNGVVRNDGKLVMGAGLAKQAMDRFPALPAMVGHMVARDGNTVLYFHRERLFTFPTKGHYSGPSTLDLIRQSASELNTLMSTDVIPPDLLVFIPQVGCGLGGLSWTDVKPILVEAFDTQNKRRVFFTNA